MKNQEEILLIDLLKRINLIDESRSDNIKRLFHFSSQIALKFLNSKYQSDRNKFLNLGYTFADIAVEAVIPLLTENKTTKELGIIKSFKEWHNPITTEEQAQYFLNKIVVNRVNQELTRIYKEADPFFAKIHDSIEYIISEEGFEKQTKFGTVYLCKQRTESIAPTISASDFDDLPDDLFVGKTKNVILKLFAILEEKNYSAAIPLNTFIKRMKHVVFSERQFTQTIVNEQYEENLDIQKLVADALDFTFNKLDSTYKNKLTEVEAASFRKTLTALSVDLSNGGVSAELFQYLKDNINEIEKEHYYKQYHSILDYLLRVLKKEIALRLEAVK